MSQKKSFWVFLLLSVCMLMTACGKQEEPVRNYENAQDLAYEIVTGSDVPHKVNEKIYKAKEKGFGFAYRDGETMYTILVLENKIQAAIAYRCWQSKKPILQLLSKQSW